MPKYYFDTINGDGLVRDTNGTELPDDQTARKYGLDALPDMARDEMPDGDQRAFTVVIRDHDKTAIYVADLSLTGRWIR